MKKYFLLIFLLFISFSIFSQENIKIPIGNSWHDILAKKEGKLVVLFTPERPFIYTQADGKIEGLEYELTNNFLDFIQKKYGVKIHTEWVEIKKFENFLESVKNADSGVIATGAITITDERKKDVKFSPPYLEDISILVTGLETPIAKDSAEFKAIFESYKALTIPISTLENNLQKIKKNLITRLLFEYHDHTNAIIDQIELRKNTFGYVSLPVYLLALGEGKKIRKQAMFKSINLGYGFVMPLNTDWDEPLNDFFSDPSFLEKVKLLIFKYIRFDDKDLLDGIYHHKRDSINQTIISTIHNDDVILTKENEINNLRDSQKGFEMNALLTVVILIIILSMVLFNAYQIKVKSFKKLTEKNLDLQLKSDEISLNNQQIKEAYDKLHGQSEEIRLQKEKLVKINSVKDQLFSIISHDIKSPLNTLKGYLSLVKMGGLTEDELKDWSVMIGEKLEDTENLVENLLNWSKGQMHGIEARPTIVDLQKIVHENFQLLKASADKKQISLKTNIRQSLFIFVDPDMISLVVRNLISNAIKFTKNGGKVQIDGRRSDQFILMSVTDTGVGISEEDKNKLFRLETQYTTLGTASEKGTGLGLVLCKNFVEDNGGKIWVESEFGKGATFGILLPAQED
ncbi:MAG: hypothetical protein EAZ97_12410 [Bacteroidetes bacterium]|nr:MAG: hypothetical protein EAZ97_12410 [Bacteroidota bacterium]